MRNIRPRTDRKTHTLARDHFKTKQEEWVQNLLKACLKTFYLVQKVLHAIVEFAQVGQHFGFEELVSFFQLKNSLRKLDNP